MCMNQNVNVTAVDACKEAPANSISFRDGNATIVVGVHFKKNSKITLEEKLKKLIQDDVKDSNF